MEHMIIGYRNLMNLTDDLLKYDGGTFFIPDLIIIERLLDKVRSAQRIVARNEEEQKQLHAFKVEVDMFLERVLRQGIHEKLEKLSDEERKQLLEENDSICDGIKSFPRPIV